jgi:hypothetical protein
VGDALHSLLYLGEVGRPEKSRELQEPGRSMLLEHGEELFASRRTAEVTESREQREVRFHLAKLFDTLAACQPQRGGQWAH